MPRRMLLTSQGAGAVVAPPMPTDPLKIEFALPSITGDDTTLAMRPSAPAAAQVVVDPAGHGDYLTLRDAFDDVENARSLAMSIKGKSTPDPAVRVDIGLAPSPTPYALPGSGDMPRYIGLYALDGRLGATEIRWGTEPGGDIYCEGISITNVDNNGAFDPKYAIHLHASGTTIFTRGTLNNIAPKAGGYPTPIGMDGAQGATLVMHNMTFASGSYTNLHGWGSPTWDTASGVGMTIVFSNITWPKGAFYYNAMNDATKDDVWVVGCTAGEAGVVGASASLHIAPSTTLTRDGDENRQGLKPIDPANPLTGVADQRADWPIPKGGLSDSDRAAWKAKGVIA